MTAIATVRLTILGDGMRHAARTSPRPMGPYPLESDGSVRIPVKVSDNVFVWAKVDPDFLGRALSYRWRLDEEGYPVTSVWDAERHRSTRIPLHRLIANAPSDLYVDHRCGDLLDCLSSAM